MKSIYKYLLSFLIACLPLTVGAQVRIFADKYIEENSDLLVKGTGLKDLKACLWLSRSAENSSACEDLYVRVNSKGSRAKIYLPSVDANLETKLVVSSGPYSSDQQEFKISIKDVTNPREELMKKFQFFTSKSKRNSGYSLVAQKENTMPLPLEHDDLSEHRNESNKSVLYLAQSLTFDERAKKIKELQRKNQARNTHDKSRFADLFRLRPRTRPPENAHLGDLFVSSSNALCIFMDSTWLKIVGSGQCIPDPVPAPVLPIPTPMPKRISYSPY